MAVEKISEEAFVAPVRGVVAEWEKAWREASVITIGAFLNSSGGDLYVGVTEDGKVVGVKKPDEVVRAVELAIDRDVVPSATGFCRAEVLSVGGKAVVAVHVLAGDRLPYYAVKRKSDSGKICYLRRGAENVEATDEDIVVLHRKARFTSFELSPARHQQLTFKALSRCCKAAGVALSKRNYSALGLLTAQGFFSNFAWWVSDQNTVETRVGFFKGADKASPPEGLHILQGSLAEQYVTAWRLLSERFGFQRDGTSVKHPAYPEVAVLEALLTLFAYRDYGAGGVTSALGSCFAFEDHLEVTVGGSLPTGASVESFQEGLTPFRNPKLEALLRRLGGGGAEGFALPRMTAAYRPYGMAPEVSALRQFLKVRLPKVTPHYGELTEREQAVVEFLRTSGAVTRPMVQQHLGRSYTTAITILKSLAAKRVVVKEGAGRDTRYRLA